MTEKRYYWAGHVACMSKEFAEKMKRESPREEIMRCPCCDAEVVMMRHTASCEKCPFECRAEDFQRVSTAMNLAKVWDRKRNASYEVEKSIADAVKKMLDAFKEGL